MNATDWASLTGHPLALAEVGADAPPQEPAFTIANLWTLGGYAAGLYWIAGGSPIWALVSIVADELDGDIARRMGESTQLGDRLDSSVDYIMAALVGVKLGLWWTLPATLFFQVWQKEHARWKPPLGSARAAGMVLALARGA